MNLKAATDSVLPFDRDPAAYKDYKQAFEKIHERPLVDAPFVVRSEHHPWKTLQFADRGKLHKDGVPYVDYSREAVESAFHREGKVLFLMTGISAHTHFEDALRVEMQKSVPYRTYIQSVSFRQQQGLDQMDRLGVVRVNVLQGIEETTEEAELIAEASRLTGVQPLLTSIELSDFQEGGLRDVAVQHIDAGAKEIDRRQFFELYEQAKAAVFSGANIEQFIGTGKFNPEAQAAVNELQKLMSGDSGQAL